MNRGTAKKTPAELEEAIELLGARIYVSSSEEKISISGNTLAKNYAETMKLVDEILLQPRWDESEFELIKQQSLSRIQQQQGDPNSIASNEFRKLIYGESSILSMNEMGTLESVNNISLDDLKTYYSNNLSPLNATYLVVGDVELDKARNAVKSISASWPPKTVNFPEIPDFTAPERSKIYFYDVPGAKQSVLNFGAPAISAKDKNFYAAEVMNYRLGGGSFASRLTQELREGKGYTYGIRSGFDDRSYIGPFKISSGVRSNITYEATELVRDILRDYASTFTQEDLDVTKSYMTKSSTRKFETLGAKLNMLQQINDYGYSDDYVAGQQDRVETMSVMDIQDLAKEYIDPDRMYFLIVGDAETQFEKLKDLGYGDPVLLNENE